MKKVLIILINSLMLSFLATAQAPKLFNYQGVAHGSSGPLINQAIGIKISIIESTANGTVVYEESHIETTNDFGLYSLAIGSGATISGTMSGVDWSSSDMFINVAIDPTGGSTYSDLGTTQLLSVPFALHTENASKADNLNQMGASNNDVLSWNGTAWEPNSVSGGFLKVDNNDIVYNNPAHFGKNLLLNTDQINHNSGDEYKIMFLPSKKGAFRAGYISNKVWDSDSIGDGSFATGRNTKATGTLSTAMGLDTKATGLYSFAIGDNVSASGLVSVAIGRNLSSSGNSSIAMGRGVQSSGTNSIGMGNNTHASGSNSTAMGYSTEASGFNSFANGYSTEASGNTSIAMGTQSKALANNSVVIGKLISLSSAATGSMYLADASRIISTQTDTRTVKNRFYAKFDGGFYFTTSGTSNVGVYMGNNDNSWSTISDSTKKENYLEADGKSFLDKIGKMKLGSWNYKEQDASKFRHYGPMAQEFYTHFGNDGIGVVGNDTTIASADIDGVMMIAIQALIKENEELKEKNLVLEGNQASLTQELITLKSSQQKTEALLVEIQAALQEKENKMKLKGLRADQDE